MEVWLSDERASFLQMGQLLAKAKLGRESERSSRAWNNFAR